MPKMKTNRMAHKKFRVNAKGKMKRAKANATHNTGKRSPKRMRRIRHGVMIDETNMDYAKRLLPLGSREN